MLHTCKTVLLPQLAYCWLNLSCGFYYCEKAANQVSHINCGNCRTTLMYPYGAPSVKCAVCQFVTNVGVSLDNSLNLWHITHTLSLMSVTKLWLSFGYHLVLIDCWSPCLLFCFYFFIYLFYFMKFCFTWKERKKKVQTCYFVLVILSPPWGWQSYLLGDCLLGLRYLWVHMYE